MKVLVPPYYERDIDHEKPFGEDFFNRKEFATNLTQLLQNSDDPLVLTINATWGEGKTTFITQWQRALKNDSKILPIYYDAFKNDFTNDVFFSIAVTIQETLQKLAKEHDIDINKQESIQYLKEATIDLAQELLTVGAQTTTKVLSNDLIDGSSFFQKLMEKIIGFFNFRKNNYLDIKFDSFLELRSTIENYQDKLTRILLDLQMKESKIVVFVDELDRCRPNFAIEVIEKIKHLFNINNVHFVLAINGKQLVKTIGQVYGVDEESAYLYLNKFVHIETALPSLSARSIQDKIDFEHYIEHLMNSLNMADMTPDVQKLHELLKYLLANNFFEITPRSIERTMSLIAISLASIEEPTADYLSSHIYLLAFFKVHDISTYEVLKKGRVSHGDLHKNEQKSKKFFKFLLDNYLEKNHFTKTASNVFEAKKLINAGGLTDIYNFPDKPPEPPKNFKINKETV